MFYHVFLTYLSVVILLLLILFCVTKGLVAKLQIVNVFGTIVTITISVYVYSVDRPQIIDIAILYALLNYISVLAFRRYFNLGILREHLEEKSLNENKGSK